MPSPIRPLEPASSGGLAALDQALVKLASHRRLLIIAAHPDDEDTTLLTWVARGLGGEAAYLSLSRGDGGQNLIGPELGVGLGLLRSRELQAARRIDGARQFFTRAYDFGYTRSLEETLERWPKEVLLEDTMRVIRRFKPQVLVAIFPPTAAAGHGQHQASGLVAEEVFRLSGDPDAFPQLDAEGLPAWQISSFYRAAWWQPEAATLELPLGTIEPFSGRSILQIALASRSQHRCQDMGSLQPLGDATGRLSWAAGAGGTDAASPFDGIDTRLAAIAALLPEGQRRRETEGRLEQVAEIAVATRQQLAAEPRRAAEPLLEIVRLLRGLMDDLTAGEAPGLQAARGLIAEKLEIANEAVANAAGVLADAVTDRPEVVPGASLPTRSIFWNAGDLPVADLEVAVESPDGWQQTAREPAPPLRSRFAARSTDEQLLTVEVPADAGPTLPFFLSRPRQGDLYDWSEVPPALRGEPFDAPPLALRFDFSLAGVPVSLRREVVYRIGDQAIGEVRHPIRAVPELEIVVEPRLRVWPLASEADTRLQVEIVSHLDRAVEAKIVTKVPEGWPAVDPIAVALDPTRPQRTVDIALQRPADVAPGRYAIDLAVETEDGRRFARALPLIDYEHVRPTPQPQVAQVEVRVDDIRLPALTRVGYVRGASDRMPEHLRRIGLPLEVLSAEDLNEQDLAGYDAIVIGSRAYEIDAALVRANPRLLDYARGGGLLIVQYQQYQFVRGSYAPFPLDIRRPHDRVTDETAAVTLLEPDHPIFRSPNRLVEADWQGWVQERGLYFAGTWNEAYKPLLAMADPGGEAKRGALLVARLGKGQYVYTGLAFFRQLPAGVTGAYRLFANLLALAEVDGVQ
ncbi:MAG: PIG-L family deacetylase [Acidobacteriota bacterium]